MSSNRSTAEVFTFGGFRSEVVIQPHQHSAEEEGIEIKQSESANCQIESATAATPDRPQWLDS